MQEPVPFPPAHSMDCVIVRLAIASLQTVSLTMGTWRYRCTEMETTSQQTWADWRVLEASVPVEPQPGGTQILETGTGKIIHSP